MSSVASTKGICERKKDRQKEAHGRTHTPTASYIVLLRRKLYHCQKIKVKKKLRLSEYG